MNPSLWLRNAGWSLVIGLTMLMVATNASAAWKEKVLYSFQGGNDGYTPAGGVVFDKAGNLYGANSWGGSGGCPSPGCGTVFEISPPAQKGGAWTEATIYAFQGVLGSVKDGLTPEGGVIIDQQGNLYGTTTLGGSGPCILLGSPAGCGIVYELSPPTQRGGPWTETILYSFQGGNDGYFPLGDLVFDKHGNLYGATDFGGGKGTTCNPYYGGNCGTVFKLNRPEKKGGTWKEKILHSFAGGTDGATPNGGLVLDAKGAVYGTTFIGGYNCPHNSGQGCGIVFELKPPAKEGEAWTQTVLHRFKQDSTDGGNPMAGVLLDLKGNLYGTTLNGGPGQYGTVFSLKPPSKGSGAWVETVLHGFNDDQQGAGPSASLIFDVDGNLYGTTAIATNRSVQGSVFQMRPPSREGGSWNFSMLYAFSGSPDGAAPSANLVLGSGGSVLSTTQLGGTGTDCQGGCGTVFQLQPSESRK